jgi:NarL family two-component system response regulator LiaR
MKKKIRVLVVEDHIVVREGLCSLIAIRPDMEVAGEAGDGAEAVLKARSTQPDVILMDLVMPRKGGIEAIAEIRQDNPSARILVLTSFAEDQNVFMAIKAGATGYMLKDSSSKELIQAIQAVWRGEFCLEPMIALKVVREVSCPSEQRSVEPMTPRQLQVLKLIAQGLSNREIAEKLVVSERTVTTHVRAILARLHLANRTQAALYAIREGLAEPDQIGSNQVQ